MQDLHIQATNNTPLVDARRDTGKVVISGDSYPENSFEFFQPLIQWLESYLHDSPGSLDFQITLAYLNTSSVRVLVDLLEMLDEAYKEGRPISLTWFYEAGNERVAELAEEFREDCSFPYQIAPHTP